MRELGYWHPPRLFPGDVPGVIAIERDGDVPVLADALLDRPPAGHRPANMTLADLSSEQMPLYSALMAHFSAGGASHDEAQNRLAAFSNELVNSARQTLLHAWALKKLDREFATQRMTSLSPQSIADIVRMKADHQRWIVILSRRQSELLAQTGINAASNGNGQSSDDNAPSKSFSDKTLHDAETESELIRSLFTVNSDANDTNESLTRLMTLLRQMGS